MSFRRLLPLLTLLALLVAPFGRMAAAETMPVSHHAAATAAMADHCADLPAPEQDRPDQSIDCMMACAAMAAADAPAFETEAFAPAEPERLPLPSFTGLNPEADPPPPRYS